MRKRYLLKDFKMLIIGHDVEGIGGYGAIDKFIIIGISSY